MNRSNTDFRVCESIPEVTARIEMAAAHAGNTRRIDVTIIDGEVRLYVRGEDEEPDCVVSVSVTAIGDRTHVSHRATKVTPATQWFFFGMNAIALFIGVLLAASKWPSIGFRAVVVPCAAVAIVLLVTHSLARLAEETAVAEAALLLKRALNDVASA